MTDEQELLKNKKLAEWAGNIEHDWVGDFCENCYESEWEFSDKPCVPDFIHSLDACFKWLVPKLQKDYGLWSLKFNWFVGIEGEPCHCMFDLPLASDIRGNAETPALALCLAIEKVIDKEAQE